MSRRGRFTDRTDFEIFRALFPLREARFWGSRSVIDPRITVAEIAKRVGLSRTAVRARLLNWKRIGYWQGYEIWPNPTALGVGMATVDVPTRTPSEADHLFDDLSLVDGVLSARYLLDDDGRVVRVYLVSDKTESLERRVRLIQRLTRIPRELRAQPYWIPGTPGTLSTLDWRILGYYRAHPEGNLTTGAASLRITPKTLAHRRDQLLDSCAMWWILDSSSTKLPVTAMYLKLGDPSARGQVKRDLEHALQSWLPCADHGYGVEPSVDTDSIAGLAFADTPADVEEIVRRILAIPGVVAVRSRTPHSFRSYPDWFDRAIAQRIGQIGYREPESALRPATMAPTVPAVRRGTHSSAAGAVSIGLPPKHPTEAFRG